MDGPGRDDNLLLHRDGRSRPDGSRATAAGLAAARRSAAVQQVAAHAALRACQMPPRSWWHGLFFAPETSLTQGYVPTMIGDELLSVIDGLDECAI